METPLALYDALLAIHVPADKARAVVKAMEHDMTAELATKTDLQHLDKTMDLKLKAQTNSIVIRLGGLVLGVSAVLEAIHRLSSVGRKATRRCVAFFTCSRPTL